ncbi:hypothetical protein [Bacillus safensis]|uniref:hypothetical protein n=1 Tax=Bacillus safensis TaxID=561879 RepID=UPI00227ED420|nr:hypothetical protein [Bacillus safensis]MCY7676332.1 hypothetical protein [Bacillus safensis]MCY7699258.1 hypothetical protein [Bacillus safensis]MEC3626846.1 hypothetical protein [Bacillus safensis]
MKLKKVVLSTTATSALLFTTLGFGYIVSAEEKVSTKDHILNFILEKNPGLEKEELMADINKIVVDEKKSEMEILEQIKSEQKSQEENINKGEITTLGNNKGTKIIGNSKKGNIYYTSAATWGLNHGHVDMY